MTRMMGERATATLGAMTLAVILAGCGTPTPTSSTAPPPTSVQSPTPTPIETEHTNPEADPADPTTWTITAEGMGPVQLDELFADAVAGVPTWTVDENCTWAAFWNDQETGVTAYFARDSEVSDGNVTTIDVASTTDTVQPQDGPRTADGLGVGSTRDDVLAAHPDAVEQKPTIGDGALLRVGPAGEGQGAIFFSFRAGEDTVSAVTVTAREEPPYEVCG
ncbi:MULTISPECIES: hypothetical protein [unclassified Microbacterium]|uniref:hypothetical protein n=1 Tax=unclassified Microbacterium TaxID=2609290 RepID=UPI0012FBC002|nr:hypothetical protein [Microbacterium sp. MAH-37]MVQ42159.1 hypothetical protein [Microbacterium sp. MAH-37]